MAYYPDAANRAAMSPQVHGQLDRLETRVDELERALATLYSAAMTMRPIPHAMVQTIRTALRMPPVPACVAKAAE